MPPQYIPYGRQDITQDDIQSVIEVLNSDFLTQGPVGRRFEKEISKECQVEHAVVTNSATSALHLAYLSLGLGYNDILWTSPITFVATSNAAVQCGAKIDFVDIDSNTFLMCPNRLEDKLSKAKSIGKLPKIVVPVHHCGMPCDMESIKKLSEIYGFSIVEDASHAIGASYQGIPVGSCRYSDITVFSFHPVKIITTGEGGAATTNNKVLADRMRLLVSHGITREQAQMTEESDGPWYYQQIDLGFNYRMSDIQAALGLSQIKRLKSFVLSRHSKAKVYNNQLCDLPILLPYQNKNNYSSYHLYVIQLNPDRQQITRRDLFEFMKLSGIGVNVHYIPVHLQPYYKNLGFNYGDFPNSERYYSRALTIPLFSSMSDSDLEFVIKCLREKLLQ